MYIESGADCLWREKYPYPLLLMRANFWNVTARAACIAPTVQSCISRTFCISNPFATQSASAQKGAPVFLKDKS